MYDSEKIWQKDNAKMFLHAGKSGSLAYAYIWQAVNGNFLRLWHHRILIKPQNMKRNRVCPEGHFYNYWPLMHLSKYLCFKHLNRSDAILSLTILWSCSQASLGMKMRFRSSKSINHSKIFKSLDVLYLTSIFVANPRTLECIKRPKELIFSTSVTTHRPFT